MKRFVIKHLCWWRRVPYHHLIKITQEGEVAAGESYAVAWHVLQRLIGLLGYGAFSQKDRSMRIMKHPQEPENTLWCQGVVIPRCHNVHTIGMKVALDIAFLDKQWKVCAIAHNVSPGIKISAPGAKHTIERIVCPNQKGWNLKIGDEVVLRHCDGNPIKRGSILCSRGIPDE